MFGRRLFLFFDLCGCGGSAGATAAAAAVRYEKWRCTSLRLLSECILKPTVYFIPCLVNRNKTRKYFPVSPPPPPPLLLCYANYYLHPWPWVTHSFLFFYNSCLHWTDAKIDRNESPAKQSDFQPDAILKTGKQGLLCHGDYEGCTVARASTYLYVDIYPPQTHIYS